MESAMRPGRTWSCDKGGWCWPHPGCTGCQVDLGCSLALGRLLAASLSALGGLVALVAVAPPLAALLPPLAWCSWRIQVLEIGDLRPEA